jgi:dihydropteroate synthase
MQVDGRVVMQWQLGRCALTLGRRTMVMGIVNLTPDSFSGDGVAARGTGRVLAEGGVARALQQLDEGAAILDLGAESTRPGSGAGGERAISAVEEQERLLPVLEAVRRERPAAVISVDTYRASTAAAAIAAGADIVNDVSGLLWDDAMAGVLARAECGVVLMHTRGRPDEWRGLPALAREAIVPMVRHGLRERLGAAVEAGIARERIVLDPGYGFGKAFDANYALLAGQRELLGLGRPLLAGVSRKSFLGRTLQELQERSGVAERYAVPGARDHASLAAQVAAVLNGASIVRVHAVQAAVEAAAIADAVLAGGV